MNSNNINPAEIVPLDIFTTSYPIAIDLVYANENHPENIFGSVYRPDARMWLHRDLAAVILLASEICRGKRPGTIFQVKDGLRTIEAQTIMLQSQAVQNNPHWIEEPDRLLSPPGAGAHPRAMAVDVVLIGEGGTPLDMGTPFDFLSEDPANNPSARNYQNLPQEALNNRALLEECMLEAASKLEVPLLPLPSEWWDFRLPPEITENYSPTWDADLPGQMRMTRLCGFSPLFPNFSEKHFEQLKEKILGRILKAGK